MTLPVTVRIPAADYDYLVSHLWDIRQVLRQGIMVLRTKPAAVPALRDATIRKPLHETKVRLSAEQFYYIRSCEITPGSVVSWMIIEMKHQLAARS